MNVILLTFLLLLTFQAALAVRKCYIYPIPHAGGRAQSLECMSNPGHDYASSGCYYRRYADDSGLLAGYAEGGCGGLMCIGGKENECRSVSETEDGFTMTSIFCCCYGETCNTVMKAEALYDNKSKI